MAGSLIGLELDNGDVLLRFVQTAHETNGELHAQEARYKPHSKPPPYHCHPHQDERFVIVEGGLHFHVDGDDKIVGSGQELHVPRGAFHRAHNPHDQEALVLWETRPALRTAEFFRAMNTITRGKPKPPLADAAWILREYAAEFQLHAPPLWVQRLLFPCLAPFASGVAKDL